MKLNYRKDLDIAFLSSESSWNKFKVLTLLQNGDKRQPSVNAYLGARYSRSADSIVEIANEIVKNNTDAAERLEKIFSGYGHKSVGDMADLFVCIENIPIYTAMRLFYMTSVVSGQERSTRYQSFDNPDFTKIPREVCDDSEVRKGYERIILKQLKDYKEMVKPTREMLEKHFQINGESQQEVSALKARTFDVVRYLLPLGLNTSSAYLMSARNWSEVISYLCANDSIVENELANMLTNLLGESKLDVKGYSREAEGLIRHADANCSRKTSTKDVLKYISKYLSREQITDIPESECESVSVRYSPDCTETVISHYELLLNPLGSANEFEFSDEDQEYIGNVLFEKHNHHNLLGNIGQSGAIRISGFASVGTLKDLNRHRSLERFVPLYHDDVDMEQELRRRNYECFFLCNYLDIPSFSSLKKEYIKRLEETYSMIRDWRKISKNILSKEVLDEFTKYLLPHAHSTKYVFYGSLDDFQYVINLRTRNGGHIAYRKLTYEWLRKLVQKDGIWKPLLRGIIEPRIDDKHQFIDRS